MSEYMFNPGRIKWERSYFALKVSAVHEIEPMEGEGLICKLTSMGSRLAINLQNKTSKDLILDYTLLTITSGTNNHKLNGSGGRYIDIDKPKANALIPAGTSHSDELMPIKGVEFVSGQWVELWYIHSILMQSDAILFVPLVADGQTRVERFPLRVSITTVETGGRVDETK